MAALQLKPAAQVHGSARCSFRGLTSSFQQLNVSQQAVARSSRLQVEGECMWLKSRNARPARTPARRGLLLHFDAASRCAMPDDG
jgi:hypothetical protein